MPLRRHHIDILIAALTLVGVTGWLDVVALGWFEPGQAVRIVVWVVSGFLAAQLARRIAGDLDLGELAIAALVAQLVVFGIHAKQKHVAIDIEVLVAVISDEAGVIIGGLTSRYNERKHRALLVLGGGAVSFGVGVLVIGIGLCAGIETSTVVLVGAIAGAMLFVLVVPEAAWWHVAVGAGLLDGAMIATLGHDKPDVWKVALVVALFAAFLGAIGGLVGGAVRSARAPKAESELPEARQVRD